MVISCGIDSANKDKAIEIILKQLDDIKNGKISDEELGASIKAMVTGVNSMRDSQMQIVDYNLSQLLAGTADSFDQLAEKFMKVGRDDIIRVSKEIELDTIYFLTSFEKEQSS
jgi:predicted Zn-dependent peptidase